MDDDRIRLRSYRLAFELERRIHRIDTFRIPLPYGLPLAALGWGAAALLAIIVLSGVPVIGSLLGLAPWPARVLFLPGLAAHLLCRVASDGRPVHEALLARLAFICRPHHRLGLMPVRSVSPALADVPCVPDERSDHYRAGVIRGPATVALRQPATLVLSSRLARLTPQAEEPLGTARELCLREGQRLVVV
jgi:hypothetical protein